MHASFKPWDFLWIFGVYFRVLHYYLFYYVSMKIHKCCIHSTQAKRSIAKSPAPPTSTTATCINGHSQGEKADKEAEEQRNQTA
jgi:hypothetical protein